MYVNTSTDALHTSEDASSRITPITHNDDSVHTQRERERIAALALLQEQRRRHFQVLKREYKEKTGREWTPMLKACTDSNWMLDGEEGDCDLLDGMKLEFMGLQCTDADT